MEVCVDRERTLTDLEHTHLVQLTSEARAARRVPSSRPPLLPSTCRGLRTLAECLCPVAKRNALSCLWRFT